MDETFPGTRKAASFLGCFRGVIRMICSEQMMNKPGQVVFQTGDLTHPHFVNLLMIVDYVFQSGWVSSPYNFIPSAVSAVGFTGKNVSH